jgi:flagellar hook-length control protein FliK
MQIDPRSAASAVSAVGDDNAAADDNSGAAGIGAAAAAAAGSAASSSLNMIGVGAQPAAFAAATAATTNAALTPPTSTAPASANATQDTFLQVAFAPLNLAGSGDGSAADSPQLQNKSAGGDSAQPQPASSIGPNGLPEMLRGLSAASAPAGIEHSVTLPVSDRNWPQAIAGQVQWMVNSNVQSATLQLSPPHLGPLEVRVDVQPGQVNVSFTAAHPDTRGALEQSLSQLRAMLATGGLTLGQATVQQEARSGSHYTTAASRGTPAVAQNADSVSVSPARGLGLVDEYA